MLIFELDIPPSKTELTTLAVSALHSAECERVWAEWVIIGRHESSPFHCISPDIEWRADPSSSAIIECR